MLQLIFKQLDILCDGNQIEEALVQYLVALLSRQRLGDSPDTVRNLPISKDARVRALMDQCIEDVFTDTSKRPNWQLLAYAGCYGLWSVIVKHAWRANNYHWDYKKVSSLCHSELQAPNPKNNPSIEAVMYFAIIGMYVNIDPKTVKLMFCRHEMLFHSDIFALMARHKKPVQNNAITSVLCYTLRTSVKVTSQLEEILASYEED